MNLIPKKRNWKYLFLKYFDYNENETVDWWELLPPILIIIGIEVLAEIIAKFIVT